MIDPAQALGFLAAAMLITLSPGPDNLMILSLGLSRGRRAGMAFGLGCALGCLSHTILAALGISAAIAASPLLFTGLKIAGGAYLVWLGVGALRSRAGCSEVESLRDPTEKLNPSLFKGFEGDSDIGSGRRCADPMSSRSSGVMRIDDGIGGAESLGVLFRRGLLANAINPKVILFFLAFLPQFVDAGKGAVGWQTAQLGLLFTMQACLLFGIIGWFAGSLGFWLGRHGRVGLWLDRLAGLVFVALGLKLIVAR